jgi:uncharacterized protein
MSQSVYINIISKDLARSEAFYTAIGCTKNEMFSDENAVAMMWSENIIFMVLKEDFAKHFSDGKGFSDQKKTVAAYYALGMQSKEAVDTFCEAAKSQGCRVYENKYNVEVASEFMYSFEVEDPDGYILEPTYMDLTQFHSN